MHRVELRIERHIYRRLQFLADACRVQDQLELTVPQLLEKLVAHLDHAISRPRSFERKCFYAIFADTLETAQQKMHASGDQPRFAFDESGRSLFSKGV